MSGKPTTRLDFPRDGIALITFDNPDRGANILSMATLSEIEKHLDDLDHRRDIHGLIFVSAKPGMFIAGADLAEFVASMNQPGDYIVGAEAMCHRGQSLFARLTRANYVSIAAIDGVCVGGGTELALWCDRRIVTTNPKSEIGLPEVKIGLIPGWGGSVRLSRIVGLSTAVEVITSGESVRSAEALQMGLVNNVVEATGLLDSAIALVELESEHQQFVLDRQRWAQSVKLSNTEFEFLKATASAMIVQQTQGHYPAPMTALEVMLKSSSCSVEQACALEAKGLSQLFGGEVNRALLNVFFLTDRAKKDGSSKASPPAKISSVAVVGAGIMGSGIAAAHIKRQHSVIISDASTDALQRGMKAALEEVAFDRVSKSTSASKLLELAPLLRTTRQLDQIGDVDLVVEAVVEKQSVKQQVLQQLESCLRPDAILATNTSTIPIAALASGLKRPDRFCGIHFFNPVRRMMLVEVIRGPQTSDATVATAVSHVRKLGKYPVVVQDGPGFLVNRLLFPYMNEALAMIAEGVAIESIDKAAKKFGMPMGPLELHDMVGLDTALLAGQVMSAALPQRMIESPILRALVEAGRLGNKSGSGFYSYANKKGKRQSDPALDSLLAPLIQRSDRQFTSDELSWRLILPMLLEATYVLDERLVANARDVDLGLVFGIGFPPFKGGLLHWADRFGIRKILELLEPLQSLGPRFASSEYLRKLAATDQTFYNNNLGSES